MYIKHKDYVTITLDKLPTTVLPGTEANIDIVISKFLFYERFRFKLKIKDKVDILLDLDIYSRKIFAFA